MRLSVKLLPFLLAAALFVGQAAGQASAPVLAFSEASGDDHPLADNQTATLSWTVSNSGPSTADTKVTIAVPDGWQYTLKPADASFQLTGASAAGPGGSHGVTVTFGPKPGAHPSNGTLTVTAEGTALLPGPLGTQPTLGTSKASAAAPLAYVPPLPPPPPPPPSPWPLILSIAGIVVLLVAAALYLASASQVRIKLSGLELVEPAGSRGTLHVLVENRARKVRKIDLRLTGLSSPWHGALMVPHVLLDGHGATEIPLSVSIPRDGEAGSSRAFQVQAKPHGLFPWLVRRGVTLRVLGDQPMVRLLPKADAAHQRPDSPSNPNSK